jgi:uncharacterized protein (TIGR00730 family)
MNPSVPGDPNPALSDRPDAARIVESPSYVLAEQDLALLARPELRPVRMQLELLKPELTLAERGIHSTIVVFGSTRILDLPLLEEKRRLLVAALAAGPTSANDPHRTATERELARTDRLLAKQHYYEAARAFTGLVSVRAPAAGQEFVIVTGGGPGIMEAANRGAWEAGVQSIGLNITLPHEQLPNPYITPELCFRFHYFAMRKMHFLLRAKALVVFPGGFGTLDELTDALTLRQTKLMQQIPIILYGREYWDQVIDFQFLADEGTISDADLDLISYANTPEEIWNRIATFHGFQP